MKKREVKKGKKKNWRKSKGKVGNHVKRRAKEIEGKGWKYGVDVTQ